MARDKTFYMSSVAEAFITPGFARAPPVQVCKTSSRMFPFVNSRSRANPDAAENSHGATWLALGAERGAGNKRNARRICDNHEVRHSNAATNA